MSLSDEVRAKLEAGRAKVKASRQEVLAALNNQPHPDPLEGLESTGDLEADTKAELDRLGKGLANASKAWAQKFALMNDTEFYAVLCFRTREQKELFLQRAGLLELGDKYIDAEKAAAILGIDLT